MRNIHARTNRNFLYNVSFGSYEKKYFSLWILRSLLPRGWFCNNSWLFEEGAKTLRRVTVSSKNNDWKVDCVRFFSLETNCFSTHSGCARHFWEQKCLGGVRTNYPCHAQTLVGKRKMAQEWKKTNWESRKSSNKKLSLSSSGRLWWFCKLQKDAARLPKRRSFCFGKKCRLAEKIWDRGRNTRFHDYNIFPRYFSRPFSLSLSLFPSETIKPISPVLFYRFSFNFLGLSHKRRWKVVEQKGERAQYRSEKTTLDWNSVAESENWNTLGFLNRKRGLSGKKG